MPFRILYVSLFMVAITLLASGCKQQPAYAEPVVISNRHFCQNGNLYLYAYSKEFGIMEFDKDGKSIPC